jgi:hypothetical protein
MATKGWAELRPKTWPCCGHPTTERRELAIEPGSYEAVIHNEECPLSKPGEGRLASQVYWFVRAGILI